MISVILTSHYKNTSRNQKKKTKYAISMEFHYNTEEHSLFIDNKYSRIFWIASKTSSALFKRLCFRPVPSRISTYRWAALKQTKSSPACSARQRGVDCQSENSRYLPGAVRIGGWGTFLLHIVDGNLRRLDKNLTPKTLHSILKACVVQAGIPPFTSIISAGPS